MTHQPEQILKTQFGFTTFREGQREVIDALLQGHSAAAVFPTGAGKSLCYQLPAVMLPHLTVVVSPLLALMKDQVDALTSKGIEAARLDSSLSVEEYKDVLSRARSGELKLLYVAPERFNNERFRSSLKSLRISLMAVDEAHCVSEWGHNFRPDYLKLSRYAEEFGVERILALTATATPKVLDDIKKRFSIETAVRTSFHRPNLHLCAVAVADRRAKIQSLLGALRARPVASTIVYVTLQRTAVEVAEELDAHGFDARPYHAGLDQELRAETQEWFLSSHTGIVVATIAFGMGIDKPNIRGVYHYDLPKSLENYSQEIGRAGRDGEDSICELIYFEPDRIPLENFVYGDTPTLPSLRSLLDELFDGQETLILNLYGLGREHDLRPLVLRTLLTYLELDGYLSALTPVYATFKFKPQASSKEMLSAYQGEEQRLLAQILKHSVKKRIWFEIDIDATAKSLGLERQAVVRAIDTCAQDGWLELKVSNLRFRYRVENEPKSLDELAESLHARAAEREAAEIGRLNQVRLLLTEPGCLSRKLASHFGEELESDCGHCSFCKNGPLEMPHLEAHDDFELGRLPNELDEPRLSARFLCGLTSPLLQKQKLTKHPDFGRLSHVSFAKVLQRLT